MNRLRITAATVSIIPFFMVLSFLPYSLGGLFVFQVGHLLAPDTL
jgi:hypothetical protein